MSTLTQFFSMGGGGGGGSMAGQAFTAPGTFTASSTAIQVTSVGGGGGGGSATTTFLTSSKTIGGGGGAISIGSFVVSSGSTHAVTIGAGGAASTPGGSTIFGTLNSAVGGEGGRSSVDGSSPLTSGFGTGGGMPVVSLVFGGMANVQPLVGTAAQTRVATGSPGWPMGGLSMSGGSGTGTNPVAFIPGRGGNVAGYGTGGFGTGADFSASGGASFGSASDCAPYVFGSSGAGVPSGNNTGAGGPGAYIAQVSGVSRTGGTGGPGYAQVIY